MAARRPAGKKAEKRYILPISPEDSVVSYVINGSEFCGNRLRGIDSVGGQNLPYPIDLACRR